MNPQPFYQQAVYKNRCFGYAQIYRLCIKLSIIYACLLVSNSTTGSNFAAIFQPASTVDTLRFESLPGESDTTEYELIIIDPDFDSWFIRNSRPIEFYHEGFLRSWNAQLVPQWNNAIVTHPNRDCRPVTYLDYDIDIDYGKELNYKLYYYFMFMQERCRIFLTFPGPRR